MIHLTKLNKHPVGVNADLIKFIENVPDTMITLLTGEKLLVLESFDEILERIVAYRQRILAGLDVHDYIVNAKGPESVRLPGVKKHMPGSAITDEGSEGCTEGKPERVENPEEHR